MQRQNYGMPITRKKPQSTIKSPLKKKEVLNDYKIAFTSRTISLIGRKEVLTGKAKFGIFGAGKELPQIALAKVFKDGDFRSGYYRDQTWMLAAGIVTIQELFAQLYAHADINEEPHSAGRQMNAHFATKSLDTEGNWNPLTKQKNSSADLSSTAAQMARAVGLAMASKKYRAIKDLKSKTDFSIKGNEICFATIGDASTSEGLFWEAINAAGVMQIPLFVNVWDDGYGISVPTKYQTTKGSISEALSGFSSTKEKTGWTIKVLEGWNYPQLVQAYRESSQACRKNHEPVLFHIRELTQPQGHSTSGSHERYKDAERLQWEKDWDCLEKMKTWIIEAGFADLEQIEKIEKEAKAEVISAKNRAWSSFRASLRGQMEECQVLLKKQNQQVLLSGLFTEMSRALNPSRADVLEYCKKALLLLRNTPEDTAKKELLEYSRSLKNAGNQLYAKHQHNERSSSALNQTIIPKLFSQDSKKINGFQVLNKCFEAAFGRDERLLAFGEDLGHIGDVNQGFSGLQEKFGIDRIFDTGIREATIMGQGIGLAMRGLRPIAEIQYLDYFIYGLQPLTDDLAPLQYRTYGQQRAPLIVRTRGHRLEGIWHAGSPMAMILNAVRGIHLCVPRNMTQAAGMYNTLFKAEDPAIVVEVLNGYRLKETLPDNYDTFTVPLGVPEILMEGEDVTVVTYGACVREAEKAVKILTDLQISVELIDIQTLLPFDRYEIILQSIKKTNRVIFLDEDVPGGASAFMMQQVLEKQGAYSYLDSSPATITAKEHRTAYGSDGDYFTKPTSTDIVEGVYNLMHESNPQEFPLFF